MRSLFSIALGGSLLMVPFVAQAQETTPSASATSTTAPTASVNATTSRTWLDNRGVTSTAELLAALDAQLTPAQKETLDKAIAARNETLQKANEKLAATLRDLLQSDDATIQARIEKKTSKDDEDRKLERMKRLQPSRYQEIMRRKKEEEQKAAQNQTPGK